MALYRAMAIQQGVSGLPEDVFVNTFYFTEGPGGTGTLAEVAEDIGNQLDSFYGDPNYSVNALKLFMATGRVSSVEYRVYDMDEPTPRQPVIVEAGWVPTGSGDTLPEEVALCLSFYKDRNIPRQRGRIFFGPIAESANNNGKPSTVLVDSLAGSGEQLIGLGQATEALASWCVYSPTTGLAHNVTDGWVDNAFDTQRRRGLAATSRQVWPEPV